MIAAVRKEKIKEIILEQKNVAVVELSELFSVTEETIRRDLTSLENEGILKRTHGGAILINRVLSNVNNKTLKKIFVESKKKIAEQVKSIVKNGDCLFFDSSTTSYQSCEEIQNMKITVVTNSLDILNKLSSHENINLICIGGNLSKTRKCFVGRNSNNILKNYYFDISFFSCRSLNIENGVTDSNDDEAEIKSIVCGRSNRTVLMVDHSKFNKVSFAKICSLNDINDIITDEPVSKEWKDFALQNNISIMDYSNFKPQDQDME
jgi:DeoR/GlpR family transcriptional regulator of sugar metabolism